MANKSDFKKTIKVEPKINIYSPNFDDMESLQHSLWIQDEVNNSRQQQLHMLEVTMQHIHQYYKNNLGNVEFYGFGRVKSPYSMEQNIKNDKNLLDAIGITFVVDNVLSDKSPEALLENAISLLHKEPSSPKLDFLKDQLEKVLLLSEYYKDMPILPRKDDSFDVELFGHPQKFKNIEVMFIHAINQFISRAKNISTTDFPNKNEVFTILRNAKSTTRYGASIDMYNLFIGYIKSGAHYEIIQRYKPVYKHNGYAAYHLGAYDSVTKLPTEFKFMTLENLYLAENGSASHQDITGKSRNFLDPLEIHSTPPQKQIAELISFFDEENIRKMLNPIPDYMLLNHDGTTRIHTPWENFEEYYERQLKAMPQEMKDLYYIGLQLVPELRGYLRPDFINAENKNKYPYNLLPIINKIANLNKQR